MSQRALTALVFFVAGLLAVVVLVGLLEKILDVTGVAVSLITLLVGITGGLALRGKTPPDGGP